MLLSRNVVVSEWRCVGMALCQNGVVSECCCVGLAFCRVTLFQAMFFTVINSLTIERDTEAGEQEESHK